MARGSLLLPLALALAAAPAAAQTCSDLAPTITGVGKIKGTPGNDVILGSEFANDATDGGGGGYDYLCSRGGDDRIKAKDAATIDAGVDEDTIKFDGVAGSNQVTGGDGIDTCKLKGSVTSSGCEEQ